MQNILSYDPIIPAVGQPLALDCDCFGVRFPLRWGKAPHRPAFGTGGAQRCCQLPSLHCQLWNRRKKTLKVWGGSFTAGGFRIFCRTKADIFWTATAVIHSSFTVASLYRVGFFIVIEKNKSFSSALCCCPLPSLKNTSSLTDLTLRSSRALHQHLAPSLRRLPAGFQATQATRPWVAVPSPSMSHAQTQLHKGHAALCSPGWDPRCTAQRLRRVKPAGRRLAAAGYPAGLS